MRCPVRFIIEGRPALRLVIEDPEFAEFLAEPLYVEGSEHHLRPSASSHETIVKILHLVHTRRDHDRQHVEFLWNAPLNVATFDRFWRLTRAHNDVGVPELVAHLHEVDLQEMEVDGDHEAAEWLRHAYEFRARQQARGA